MPRIVIVGGKLQGTEAAYLGREAGMEIILIDKNPLAPAQNLCSEFICDDVLSGSAGVKEALDSADMILPTMENDSVLEWLVNLAAERNYVLAFDREAYQMTESKLISDKIFADNDLPCPQYYPKGKAPYIAKPIAESGSHGIRVFDDKEAAGKFIEEHGDGFIVQEFVEGPSFSIEIIGRKGNYRTYEPTQIFIDEVYDCNVASALRNLEPEKQHKLEELAVTIAELIGLEGIMDLEVIDHEGELKILEIDARLPSQTSIAVYHASGMNYIKELYDLFCKGDFSDEQLNCGRYASFSNFLFSGDRCTAEGEHIMVEGGLLDYTDGICEEAVVISDYANSDGLWRGIFINHADSAAALADAEAKMRTDFVSKGYKLSL